LNYQLLDGRLTPVTHKSTKKEFTLFRLDLSPIFFRAASWAAPEPGNFASALARGISRL